MGVTPIEAGFSFAGLVVAGRIFSVLLPIYLAIITAGIVWMIYHGLLATSWKPLLIYLFSVGLLLTFFGVNKNISTSDATSAAESAGAPLVSSSYSGSSFANSLSGTSTSETSGGLFWINSFLDAIVTKCIQAVDQAASDDVDKFIGGSPFSFIEMQKTTWAARVKDPVTRASLMKFLQGPYQNAVYRWVKGGSPDQSKVDFLYPGTFKENYYTADEKTQWEEIEQDIINYEQSHTSLTRWAAKVSGDVATWAAKKAIKNETAQAFRTGAFSAFQATTGINRWMENQAGDAIRRFGYFIARLATSIILPAIPVVQGIANYIALAAFPLIFFLAVFPNNQQILAWFFVGLLWIKSWSIGWAILNSVQNLGWYFGASSGSSALGGESYIAGLILPVLTLGLLPVIPIVLLQLLTKGMGAAMAGGHALMERGAGAATSGAASIAEKSHGAALEATKK